MVPIMKKTKIMIVEDEILIAMNMKSDLIGMGYEVCELVTTGEAAIKNTEHESPDVVMMDIILNGEMNGIDAAREIRSRYGIPIIFITGCEDEGTKELAEDVGPVEYFVKPVELVDLKSAIDKAIS